MSAPSHRRVIVWMRRAYRLLDNTPLLRAVADAAEVIPVICLSADRRYLEDTPRRRFVRSSLVALDDALRAHGSRLHVLVGTPEREIPAFAAATGATAVYVARTYGTAGRNRESGVAQALGKAGVLWSEHEDVVIAGEQAITTAQGRPFTVFTPFRNAWLRRFADVGPPPDRITTVHSPEEVRGSRTLRSLPGFGSPRVGEGGEDKALARLAGFMEDGIQRYAEQRNMLSRDGTSRLSPHLALGTLSVRTVYRRALDARGNACEGARRSIDVFISELLWREFSYHVLMHFPFVTERAFREDFASLEWRHSRSALDAWKEGRTGYPVVDAAMRQLAATGWMHNRGRMIAASFLVKDLQIDWRKGERHFGARLIDADIASNNAGWQWTAGTGTDAAPYFRVLNPVLQGRRFDPDGTYVRTYVPELADLPTAFIHAPWTMPPDLCRRLGWRPGKRYPKPLVDHAEARRDALAIFRMARPQGHSGSRKGTS